MDSGEGIKQVRLGRVTREGDWSLKVREGSKQERGNGITQGSKWGVKGARLS